MGIQYHFVFSQGEEGGAGEHEPCAEGCDACGCAGQRPSAAWRSQCQLGGALLREAHSHSIGAYG